MQRGLTGEEAKSIALGQAHRVGGPQTTPYCHALGAVPQFPRLQNKHKPTSP